MDTKRVLIVDDEIRLADSLGNLLSGIGYQVQTASDGQRALETLETNPAHVVITDLRMPDIDGLELIRLINEKYPRILIIVITGHATTESAIEAVHYHVFDFIRKPFEFDLVRMALDKAFQKIETEQLREDTSAMITHDIKIPLTSIIGFASMVYDKQTGTFHPRAVEFLETIQANGQKIMALIENYLTTCKVESGTLEIAPVPSRVGPLIRDVVASARADAQRRGHELVEDFSELPRQVDLDEVLIYRALGNLIQNAIKYSSAGEPIVIRAGMRTVSKNTIDGPAVCIDVINRTLDLDPHQLDDLFQRYRRTRASQGIEGSGIGLYVVDVVARAHGGAVEAQMIQDQKVRFTLYLPMAQPRGKLLT